MDKFFRYAACVAALTQFVVVLLVLPEIHRSQDMLMALMLLVLPILTVIAIYAGPGIEERRLKRKVTVTRLQRELEELGGDKKD